ncbi:hypothetical protein QR685DRAFT_603232 [Neurospora intermedia]|uniref:Uncharacterized protein n=1 Tax=Neurospora intermedia TaxID=5142 RepID=A0ABR3DWA4_NEUIN
MAKDQAPHRSGHISQSVSQSGMDGDRQVVLVCLDECEDVESPRGIPKSPQALKRDRPDLFHDHTLHNSSLFPTAVQQQWIDRLVVSDKGSCPAGAWRHSGSPFPFLPFSLDSPSGSSSQGSRGGAIYLVWDVEHASSGGEYLPTNCPSSSWEDTELSCTRRLGMVVYGKPTHRSLHLAMFGLVLTWESLARLCLVSVPPCSLIPLPQIRAQVQHPWV